LGPLAVNLESTVLQKSATIIVVDLPGHGASDCPKEYTATDILGLLAEFILTVRKQHGHTGPKRKKTVIVAQGCGCILAMRLAAEAPELADRFILSNGPVALYPRPSGADMILIWTNSKPLARHDPIKHQTHTETHTHPPKTTSAFPNILAPIILEANKDLFPILKQAWMIGYVFAFQLPMPLPIYLGTTRHSASLKVIHELSYGKSGFTIQATTP
jgi:pimeloyl-ACP methyl ester carboxylesterase